MNTEYILFIHGNNQSQPKEKEWGDFFALANESGLFNGGSEISPGVAIGQQGITPVSQSVVGYMRFETDNIESLYQLLESHPVKLHGGTLELCETPKN